MKYDPKIDFYRSDAVYIILKRYDFSDAEKEIIQAAILTAKRVQPNIKIIQKADTLLKSITQNQKPIETETFQMDKKSLIGIAQLERKKEEKGKFPWIISLLIVQVLGVLIVYQYMGDDKPVKPPQLYTFHEAKMHCKSQGQVLPLTMQDAPNYLEIPNELNDIGYWSDNKKVIYNLARGEGEAIFGKKHYVVCVETNGKGIIRFSK